MASVRLLALSAWVSLVPLADAVEIHVPADYPTIQAGINAAQEGDDVIVADGVYTGPGNKGLFFPGPVITLRSENGPDACVIDLEGSGVAFFLVADEDPGIVVQGFTVRNGAGSLGGAAFLHHDADLQFVDCVFTSNVSASGGAVHVENSASATFIGCTFSNNTGQYGGAVHVTDSSDPTFIACTFTDNTASVAGGAIYCSTFGTTPRFFDCTVTGNGTLGDGGGAFVRSGKPSLERCTIAGNTATARGGGLAVQGPGTAAFEGGILWGDAAAFGKEIALIDDVASGGAVLEVGFSDVQGGAVGASIGPDSTLLFDPTNQDADPLFLDLAAGDVRIPGGSPVLDAADPFAVLDPAFPYDVLGFGHPRLDDGDFDGLAVVDQGAVEFGGLLGDSEVAGGATTSLDLWGKGGAFYGVALGVPGTPLDLGPAGTVFLSAAPLTVVASGVLPPAGTATVLTAVAPPAAIGITVSFQAGTIGPAPSDGLHLSNLESVTIVAP